MYDSEPGDVECELALLEVYANEAVSLEAAGFLFTVTTSARDAGWPLGPAAELGTFDRLQLGTVLL